jgi:hypothetical protein
LKKRRKYLKNGRIDNRKEEIMPTISDWQRFYREEFGIFLDEKNIWDSRSQFRKELFSLVIACGLKIQQVYERCAELFPCWKYTDRDLDEVINSDRTSAHQSYLVWIRPIRPVAEIVSGAGITLLEGLVLELFYFRETERHLNAIRCPGSRNLNGNVLCLGWGLRPARVDFAVYWAYPWERLPTFEVFEPGKMRTW